MFPTPDAAWVSNWTPVSSPVAGNKTTAVLWAQNLASVISWHINTEMMNFPFQDAFSPGIRAQDDLSVDKHLRRQLTILAPRRSETMWKDPLRGGQIPCSPRHLPPPHSKPAPALLKNTPIQVHSQFNDPIRFAAACQHQVSAITGTTLTVQPGQYFTPLKATNIAFVDASHGEPKAKRPKLVKSKQRKPILNIARPVKNAEQIHLDAWRIIFSYSNLKFLLEAKTVCKAFNTVLKDQSIWRMARELEFGADMPPPPGGLTEQQYAELLVGKGCQARFCTRTHSSKVYWAFGVRLCQDCLRRATLTRSALKEDRIRAGGDLDLLHLLPAATFSRGKYGHCRRFESASKQWISNDGQLLFLRKDINSVEAEILRRTKACGSDVELAQWMSAKLHQVGQFAIEIARIEQWDSLRNRYSRPIYSQRREFFFQKAADLDPPMSPLVLQRMLAYQKAMEIDRPADDQTWARLLPKILPYRAQAEAMLYGDPSLPSSDVFRRLYYHRCGRKGYPPRFQPEQQFVLGIAQRALTLCGQMLISDSHLVLACLQLVFQMYEAVPESEQPTGMRTDGSEGPYRLSLDDARMIVEDIIEPHFDKYSPRYSPVLRQFKCMGCHRKDWSRTYSFTTGLQHVFQSHAQYVGDGSNYNTMFRFFPSSIESQSFSFPWFTVEWPRCLPLLPSQSNVHSRRQWEPDTLIDFTSTPQTPQISAFAQRRAWDNPEIEDEDFCANASFAATVLENTEISSLYQIKIALKYAMTRYSSVIPEPLPLPLLTQALRSMEEASSKIDLRFRCAVCSQGGHIHRGSSFVKHPVALHALLQHWQTRHCDEGYDAIEMLEQPDDFETMEEILRTDTKLKERQESIRSRELKRLQSPRMKATPKAGVVLNMHLGKDVLDRLFPEI